MLHEIIIWATVLLIISLQIKIFLETRNKIKSYESIMKNPQSFETFKIYISEKEIETIDSQHILDNLNHYTQNPSLRPIDEIVNTEKNFQPNLFEDFSHIDEQFDSSEDELPNSNNDLSTDNLLL
jgi:hypothetical protein